MTVNLNWLLFKNNGHIFCPHNNLLAMLDKFNDQLHKEETFLSN